MTETSEMTVERNVDFKAMGAAFMEHLAAPLELFLNTAVGGEADADRRLREAAAAYQSDLTGRQAALNEKISAVQAQLDECHAETEKAVEALSAALSHDDEAGEAAAKQAVDEQAQAEFLMQRRMDTLSRVTLTGNDDLYLAVLDAAGDCLVAQSEMTEAANLVIAFIDELTEQLNEIRRKAKSHDNADNLVWEHSFTRRAWPVIENHDGAPDFSGASAGDQEWCRYRYLKALCRREYDTGFNFSPAGDQLMKTIRSIYIGEREED